MKPRRSSSPTRAVSTASFDGSEDALADENLAAVGVGAETGGEVCHRADGSVVVAPLEADPAKRRVPGLDPDPEPELDPPLSPRGRELVEPLVGGKCKPDCPQLVIAHR